MSIDIQRFESMHQYFKIGKIQRENQIIIGENSKVLLKMINSGQKNIYDILYIDAPYNTGNEHFLGENEKNRQEAWVSMLDKRIRLSLELLKETGFVLMSMDDSQIGATRVLLDEILDKKNYIATFVWQRRNYPDDELEISVEHEYVICYRMSEKSKISKKVSTFIFSEKLLDKAKSIRKDKSFTYLSNEFQDEARKEINEKIGSRAVTNYPKPVNLLVNIFQVFMDPKEPTKILDIFAGSGTTAEALLKINKTQRTNKNTFTLIQMEKEKKDKVYKSVQNLTIERAKIAAKLYDSKIPLRILE